MTADVNIALKDFVKSLTPEQVELFSQSVVPHFLRYQAMEALLLDPKKFVDYKTDFFNKLFPEVCRCFSCAFLLRDNVNKQTACMALHGEIVLTPEQGQDCSDYEEKTNED